MNLEFMITVSKIFRQGLPAIGNFILAGLFLFLVYSLLKILKYWLVYGLKWLKLDMLSEKIGLQQILKTSGIDRGFAYVVGEVLFFLALISTLIISLYIVFGDKVFGLTTSVFAYYVGEFSYSVFSAVLILIVGMVVATFMYRIVRFVSAVLALPAGELVARFAQIAVIINAILRALYSVGLIGSMNSAVDILGVALVASLSFAFAFSLRPFFDKLLPTFLAELPKVILVAKREFTPEKKVILKKKVKKKKKISLNKKVKLTDNFLSAEVHKGLRSKK